MNDYCGIIILNKPTGISSHRCVGIARKALDMKKLESAEAQMLKKHQAAREEARKVLRTGGFSARKKAIDIMEKAFAENMKAAEKFSAAL